MLRAPVALTDAHRHAGAQAEGVADGDHRVAGAERVARSEHHGGQAAGALEPDERHVEHRVARHHGRREGAPVVEVDAHVVRAVDDVAAGEHQAVGRDQHARSQRVLARRHAPSSVKAALALPSAACGWLSTLERLPGRTRATISGSACRRGTRASEDAGEERSARARTARAARGQRKAASA